MSRLTWSDGRGICGPRGHYSRWHRWTALRPRAAVERASSNDGIGSIVPSQTHQIGAIIERRYANRLHKAFDVNLRQQLRGYECFVSNTFY